VRADGAGKPTGMWKADAVGEEAKLDPPDKVRRKK